VTAECPKCKVQLRPGTPERQVKRSAYVRSDRYGGKRLGESSNVTLTPWICPSCGKTKAVS
jgi:hypothetical protein